MDGEEIDHERERFTFSNDKIFNIASYKNLFTSSWFIAEASSTQSTPALASTDPRM